MRDCRSRHTKGFRRNGSGQKNRKTVPVCRNWVWRKLLYKSVNILWKAASAIPNSCIQELFSYSSVQTHSFGNLLYVGSCKLAYVCDGINERNFCCKKGVRCMLYYLCTFYVSNYYVCVERFIKFL